MRDIVWSALTIALAGAKNFGTLVALRFFTGLAEATFYPGMQHVLGSWYKPTELGKRACRQRNRADVQWFPADDLPHNTKPSYTYTERELAMACKRMNEIDRRAATGAFTKEKIHSFLTTWHIYTLVPIYVLYNNGLNPSLSMIYWFKSFNTSEKTVYSVGQINTYPLGEYAVQIVTS
ncbi:hypothetical protein FISHEDRAFT_73231 [Fistulina hepatica ATCC 64428]|uniref:MFS general substrate transporter n=1 Tax=Fistulina hepatica ATCC 64428 TaxID=1128425 RepID=A0A0D7ADY5_9AGAR|nr:hypothetical protein FISHEDRAFT_73231 [Fistulina hepatica ATCC 64428]